MISEMWYIGRWSFKQNAESLTHTHCILYHSNKKKTQYLRNVFEPEIFHKTYQGKGIMQEHWYKSLLCHVDIYKDKSCYYIKLLLSAEKTWYSSSWPFQRPLTYNPWWLSSFLYFDQVMSPVLPPSATPCATPAWLFPLSPLPCTNTGLG